MMAGVGDRQPIAGHCDFAGIAQDTRRNRARVAYRRQRRPIDRPVRVVRCDQPLHYRPEHVGRELTRVRAEHRSLWVDHDHRGPRAHGVGPPNAVLSIVDNGMIDVEALCGLADARRLPLRDVFATVHADDHDVPRESALELPQLREDVQAIDSAVRPEIQQDHFAAEGIQRQRSPTRIYPIEVGRKRRSPDRGRRQDVVGGHGFKDSG